MNWLLNQYFTSVFIAENHSNILEVISANPSYNLIETFDNDDSEVLNKLLKLKDGKATGDNGYPTKLMKELSSVISSPQTLFFLAITVYQVPSLESSNTSSEYRNSKTSFECPNSTL